MKRKVPEPPPLRVADALLEILLELKRIPQKTPYVLDQDLRTALTKTFGSVGKGYGALVSLRNALRSVPR